MSRPAGGAGPEISIVLGHPGAAPPDPVILSAFAREAESAGAEIILVTPGRGAATGWAVPDLPGLRVIDAPGGALVPQLWSEGIRAARGPFVALSVSAMEPDAGWLSRGLARLADPGIAGIGGAIENVPSSSPAHWAVYFARYSAYMLPFREHEAPDLPGDNAIYRRESFRCAAELVDRAFWEPQVHAVMGASGWRLLMDPALVARHHPSFGAAAFLVQRFRHGRQHGASRAAGRGPAARVALALASPLVPLVMYGRIARRVWARARGRLGRLAAATPHLTIFLIAWALGEAAGAILGEERPAGRP